MNLDIAAIICAPLAILSAVITCLLILRLKNKTIAEQLAVIEAEVLKLKKKLI